MVSTRVNGQYRTAPVNPRQSVRRFVRAQVVNTQRNLHGLRAFRADDFGSTPASPSTAHLEAVNALIAKLRGELEQITQSVSVSAAQAERRNYDRESLQAVLHARQRSEVWIKRIEKVWAYYLELFGQRQTTFGELMLATDRIALDCYEVVYTNLGAARSIPSPGPFTYMETGFTPATFRRGVALTRLSKQINPFPIVSLPYHRLLNPWTLGAVHHEVSHNLQSDLGLWNEVPKRLRARLLNAGVDPLVVNTWTRWHKETWADLTGLLLSGPATVASLMDVVARSYAATTAYHSDGVHPVSYLRVLINLELLRRMGFAREAAGFDRVWRHMYGGAEGSRIPPALLRSFPQVGKLVVDTLCFQPYPQLGNKSLAQVVCFTPDHQQMTQEAARRLAAGTDPGIIPARFLVGAARWAFDQRLAAPEVIARNFYDALKKR